MSLHVARRRTKTKIEPGAPSSREDPAIHITTTLLALSDILNPLSCLTLSRPFLPRINGKIRSSREIPDSPDEESLLRILE